MWGPSRDCRVVFHVYFIGSECRYMFLILYCCPKWGAPASVSSTMKPEIVLRLQRAAHSYRLDLSPIDGRLSSPSNAHGVQACRLQPCPTTRLLASCTLARLLVPHACISVRVCITSVGATCTCAW